MSAARMPSSLVLRAEEAPLTADATSANRRYRNPTLALEDRPLPDLKPGWLRIEVLRTGICGTDVHMVQTDATGYVRCSAPAHIPVTGRVLGHEGAGRVVAVGSADAGFRPGDLVAPESIMSCGACATCRRGQFNQCERAALLGMQLDGLFATMADIPARCAVNIGRLGTDANGLRMAACLEPAGIALLSAIRTDMRPGDRVLVLGAGPIGALCAMLAQSVFGAACVGVVEPSPFRREFVSSWCDVAAPDVAQLQSPRAGWDIVIEASGNVGNIDEVLPQVAACGRMVLLGRSGQPLRIDAVDRLITNAISVIGLRGHLGGVYERLIDLCQAGRLPLDQIITREIEGLGALRTALSTGEGLEATDCKVMVRVSD
jgi:2-desacetyl-2-hydroxyethyl bacteriochlorophyllide A dehydrogenase